MLSFLSKEAVKQLQNNDNTCEFEVLYYQYKNIFFNYLKKVTNNYHLAEDLLQESFIKIALKLSTLKDISKFRSWGFQIVANTCRDWYRKNKKEQITYTDHIERIEDTSENNSDPVPEDIIKIINEILSAFNYEEKEVFILKEYENMTYEEISKVLHMSRRTVRRRMKTAVTKLIKELEKAKYKVGPYFNLSKRS